MNKIFGELKLYSMFSLDEGKAVLEIVNSAERVVFTSHTAAVEMKGCTAIQGIGAVHSYMKRYLYMNALEIVEHDMLDATVGDNKIDYDRTIDNIRDVKQLNNTYRFLIDNARNDSWKKRLNDKCKSLNAIFNNQNKAFEAASVA